MRNRKYDIERYLRGELSPSEMHALEREALNDPFLAEALEGIEQTGRDNFLYDLHQINRSVRDRMRKKSSRLSGKSVRMWGWTSAIAASVLLIAVSGFLVVNLLREQAAREQALNSEPEVLPDTTSAKDTLTIVLPAEHHVRKPGTSMSQNPITDAGTSTARFSGPEKTDVAKGDVAIQSQQPDYADESGEMLTALEEAPESAGEPDEPGRQLSENTTEEQISGAAKRSAQMVESRSATRAEAEAPAIAVIGRVVDPTGGPLPGVNVMIKGTNIGTVTNADGDFQLSLPSNSRSVVFSFIGFESQEVEAVKPVMNVTMQEDVSSLSEVVVTGYGVESSDHSNTTFRFAEPAGGRNEFRDYLSRSVQYPQDAATKRTEGRVTVRFTVNADGQLSDFEVLKGIGSGCEEALIEAIKNGPVWKPSTRGDMPVSDKVRVRYKFELR